MTSQHSLFNSIISTPPIFIAEIGGNHNGNVVLGQKMIDAAISSGAQIIKFQTYTMSDFVAFFSLGGQMEPNGAKILNTG